MYFKRIEIHGFKSFAEPVVIEFDRGITCVVGPNGSGKSNICDALRWVLGAQSAKALRGDKMEDVIFSGTAARKSRGMAEVTLVIDNSDGELNIDYNEVAITRRMYRSGESEYLINDNRCRMKDIRELIMDTGIGVEGYSIIGQGKISDIISNNTESIREILEETAGIVMYRSKKRETENKLNSATNNLEKTNITINELEDRIPTLKEESEKAKEYIELRDKNKTLEINITLKNIETTEQKHIEVKNDIRQLESSISMAKADAESYAEILEKNEAKRNELDAEIDVIAAEESRLTGEITELNASEQVNQERLKGLSENIATFKIDIEGLDSKINRELANSRELMDRKAEADETMAKFQSKLNDIIDDYNQKNAVVQNLVTTIDDAKAKIFDLSLEIGKKKSEIKGTEAIIDNLEGSKKNLLEDDGNGSEGVSDIEITNAEAKQQALDDAVSELQNRMTEMRQAYSDALMDERNLSRELENVRVAMGQLRARKRTFEEMQANYEGYNNAVKFLMKENISGIEGVVADIIKVPAGYELAIETALGATVQNIVCANDQSAKEGVRALKRNSAGRATFLPLTSMKARPVIRDQRAESAPGFVGYGVEIVDFDDRYEVIAQFTLGNVIVMEDMDSAVALSKRIEKNVRFVTIEGEIVNASGSITGGKYKNKSANILERKAEVTSLAEEIEKQEAEIRKGEEDLRALQAKATEIEEKTPALEGAIVDAQAEAFAQKNEVARLKASQQEQLQGEAKRTRQLESIDEQTSKAEDDIARLKGEISDLEADQTRLEATIEEAQAYYEEKVGIRDAVADSITQARIDFSNAENDKKYIDEMVEKLEEQLEEYKRERNSKQRDLDFSQNEKNKILESKDDKAGTTRELEEKRDAITERLGILRNQKSDLVVSIDNDKKAKDNVDRTLESLQGQKYELDIKAAKQEASLESAKEKLWEDFELSYIQAMDFRSEDFNLSAAVKENREIRSRLRALGDVNVGSIEEYAEVMERYEFLAAQRDDVVQSMNELQSIINEMDKVIRKKFKESFDQVVENFESVFAELYGGGHATITLEDPDNPFESEIEISAQPPGKQLKHINLLSGGEKTMTAIALMFAVLKTKPTPCCILDEIEAALDESNLGIFGDYIEKFKGVQFTLITHQKATMEHADVMYGITMPESGVSRVYSLKMGDEPIMDNATA